MSNERKLDDAVLLGVKHTLKMGGDSALISGWIVEELLKMCDTLKVENTLLHEDKKALNIYRGQLESDCELYNRNWRNSMEEVNKLRNILELGRKFGESIANNPKDQACVELMSPETFEMLKKFGEALKNLED